MLGGWGGGRVEGLEDGEGLRGWRMGKAVWVGEWVLYVCVCVCVYL